ncbi:MAG TPA: hypothetical protein PKW33_17795 [Anaerolineaceae bacterium]|nr:hypothetical protein [Anaerolineaceae bacterium]HPN53453.1 hypothetical protein [Anaerolineaceae bacterium]
MMMKTLLLLAGALALCLVSPSRAVIWQWQGEGLAEVASPQVTPAMSLLFPQTAGDLDGDGAAECLLAAGQGLTITDCRGGLLWQSPDTWEVKEAQVSDLNRDGQAEAVLLVWRPFKPWPVDRFMPAGGRISAFHDQNNRSCHVILIGWKQGRYRELWAGSALIRPLSQLKTVDLDGDGWQELAALEGDYDADGAGGILTVWRWRGFSFSLAAKEDRPFRQLQVIGSSKQNWLITR